MANLTAALSVISETCATHKYVFSKLVHNFIGHKIKTLCISSRLNVLDKIKIKTCNKTCLIGRKTVKLS